MSLESITALRAGWGGAARSARGPYLGATWPRLPPISKVDGSGKRRITA